MSHDDEFRELLFKIAGIYIILLLIYYFFLNDVVNSII